jgi:pimeloyl-ACP methyl ester carboxylesterase
MVRISSALAVFRGNGRSAKSWKTRPTVVIVHGAWTDGSAWSDVIARLQANGVLVVAAQIPLSSLSADAAFLRRELAICDEPVVLVGHAWGGTVITEGGDDRKVAALVYVAGFAPRIGESTNDLTRSHSPPGYVSLVQVDAQGYWRLPQGYFAEHMAQDLPGEHARVLASTQVPFCGHALDELVTRATWEQKPSWYLITERDRMIDPALQLRMAARMGAKTTSVRSSHMPFITRPQETADIILEAVSAIL